MKWLNLARLAKLVIALSLTAATVLAGNIPNTLNYQGTLTDSTGKPVTAAAKSVTFKLYTSALGGAAFWTEPQSVPVTNGQFSAVLGNSVSLPTDKFTGNTYVGITVDSGPEMLPRQKLTSVAYALKAADAIPKGVIVMWSGAGGQVPEGWALCDGTNGTPNLKDKFVIGVGLTSIGTTGGASTINLSHSHTVNSHTHPGVNHLHSISHDHFVSRVNDGSYWSEWGHGLESGGGFSGYTYGSQTNTNSGPADRDLTTGATAPGTNSQLNSAQSILPPYYGLAFIMKL